MNHRSLVEITRNYESCVMWLFQKAYIRNYGECEGCIGASIKIIKKAGVFCWKCCRCKKTFSIFKGTIFFNSNKPLVELIDLVYFWSLDLTQNKTRNECETKSRKTVGIWYNKLKKLSYSIMKAETPAKIGGDEHMVEIDESLFSKRKYNIGRIVRTVWVVGGIDLDTGHTFFVETPFRNKESLNRIILQKCRIRYNYFYRLLVRV